MVYGRYDYSWGVKINQLIIRGPPWKLWGKGGAREGEGRTECPVHTLGKHVERERRREIVE